MLLGKLMRQASSVGLWQPSCATRVAKHTGVVVVASLLFGLTLDQWEHAVQVLMALWHALIWVLAAGGFWHSLILAGLLSTTGAYLLCTCHTLQDQNKSWAMLGWSFGLALTAVLAGIATVVAHREGIWLKGLCTIVDTIPNTAFYGSRAGTTVEDCKYTWNFWQFAAGIGQIVSSVVLFVRVVAVLETKK